jgi:hypothetical protein
MEMDSKVASGNFVASDFSVRVTRVYMIMGDVQ